MGYFVMAVRTQDESETDDYVIWDTIEDAPVLRGTEDEIREWWREEFGRSGLRAFDLDESFDRANRLGSNSYAGNGHWNEELRAAVGAKAGILRRESLREFLGLYFAEDNPRTASGPEYAATLLEPFEWEKDAEADGDGR